MSTKRFKELKNLSETELQAKLRDSERKIFELRMQNATGQLEKTADLWKTRKDIARLKTLMSGTKKASPARRVTKH
jgi:large subunit ribosomal protein L29